MFMASGTLMVPSLWTRRTHKGLFTRVRRRKKGVTTVEPELTSLCTLRAAIHEPWQRPDGTTLSPTAPHRWALMCVTNKSPGNVTRLPAGKTQAAII